MKSRATNPRVSVVCATGSRWQNDPLRAELLWRMVNSAHEDPGYPFEMILVDNCEGPGSHRDSIDGIFEAYATVTHVIRNRVNEFHGGGIRQGLMVADGDLFVQITDDLELRPGWLEALIAPLREDPRENLVAALLRGHNATGKRITRFDLGTRQYELWTNAAAYCWAFWPRTVAEIGAWRRAHYADTRWSRKLQSVGYRFVVPAEKFAVETNLNFLRPWDYEREKEISARTEKLEQIDRAWRDGVVIGSVYKPPTGRPLKNPEGIGPRKVEEYDVWVRQQHRELGWT